ncbi:hypothetical protein Tco_0218660 [Tanacetum coccineum]
MAELLLNKSMEKAQTESNLSIIKTIDDMNIKLSKEFLTELRNNAYHGIHHEYVVDHIAMVLEMLDLVNVPGKITTWEELVEKFFCKFYPKSYDGEEEMLDEGNLNGSWNRRRMDDSILSSGDTTTNSILEPYLKTQEKNNTEKDDERRQMKCKCNDSN